MVSVQLSLAIHLSTDAEAHQAWLAQLLDHDDVRLAGVPWLRLFEPHVVSEEKTVWFMEYPQLCVYYMYIYIWAYMGCMWMMNH